jgi:peptidyl-prolyl cis-trans isomerase B (cyclophilin B)
MAGWHVINKGSIRKLPIALTSSLCDDAVPIDDPSKRKNERSMSRKSEVEAAIADVDFENKKYQVQLTTSVGDIHLDLLPEVAPEHCKNLIGLARIGFYDGLIFHRVISGFMIQGGCPEGTGTGGPGYNVDAEFNETPHVAGVLSMARSTNPNSAGSQFFICLGEQAYLDGQYTAFGKATDDSMETVEAIGNLPTGAGDRPREDVTINKATVVEV